MNRVGSSDQKYHGFPISATVNLDGKGICTLSSGIAFLDHLIEIFARYGYLDIDLKCEGDVHVDDHHTVDEIGLALGSAIHTALSVDASSPIQRHGFYILPMDECLTTVALDLCGRSSCSLQVSFERECLGKLSTEMIPEFFNLLCQRIPMTLIVKSEFGRNDHHKAEGLFKTVGRAFGQATRKKN